MTRKKAVSFELAKTRYFGEFCSTVEDLKSNWYSEHELQETRDEARMCVVALHAAEGKLDRVNPTQFCLRGIEKFANLASKARLRRLLMTSILGQQQKRKRSSSMDECRTTLPSSGSDEELAALSRYLTQPSRDLAYSFGLLNAAKVSEQEEEDSSNTGDDDSDSTSSAEHEKNEQVAASALLCMSPGPIRCTTDPSVVVGLPSFPPTSSKSSSSSCISPDDYLPSPPSKRQRVTLIEEPALAREVHIHR